MGYLTSHDRDRLTLEVLEKKIIETVEKRQRVDQMRKKLEELMVETDQLVEQLLSQLNRTPGYDFSSISLNISPCSSLEQIRPMHLDYMTKTDDLFYGCEDVFAELDFEITRLQKAVLALGLMEDNPLSVNGGFRHEAARLKIEMKNFVGKINLWANSALQLLIKKHADCK